MSHAPDPLRIKLEHYPFHWVIDTSFGDMDAVGHINNVALARYYETARSRWLMEISKNPQFFQSDLGAVIAEYTIRFLGEVNFPEQITVATAVDRIGNSSFSSVQGIFVNNRCVGLSDASMVFTQGGKPSPIEGEFRRNMEQFFIGPA